MDIRNTLNRTGRAIVEELQNVAQEPEARSVDNHPTTRSRHTEVVRTGDVDKHYPDREKLRDYWEIFHEIPIIRHPIRSFASEVISPGYYVDAEDEELKKELEDWLETCAIVDGEIDEDFLLLLKKAQIQREVKGTALFEKVRDEEDNLYGFKLMRPETVRAFTKPAQTVLLPPDYDIEEMKERTQGLMNKILRNQDFYTTDDGEVAAFVQLDDVVNGQNQGYYVPFTRDDVIKLTRDSDVGDVFGQSRIAAVEDRLNSLLKKLDDNDKAIESLAHPFQLFKFGTEEDPWEPEEIAGFMNQHKQSEFEPGMKQGVQGDLDVETVSGEVAPIQEFLQFDLNWIISEMPMPKYSLGGFTSDVNQFVSRSQSARLERQVEESRNEIQNELNPVLREKTKELGYDEEDFNNFVIGEDPSKFSPIQKMKEAGEIPEDSDVLPDNSEGGTSEEPNVGPDGSNQKRPPASTEPGRDGGPDVINGDS